MVWLCCAELLYGGKIGVYQYNTALNITTKTADGVVSWPSLSTILLSLQHCSAPQPAVGAHSANSHRSGADGVLGVARNLPSHL